MEPLRCFIGLEAFHPILSRLDWLVSHEEIANIRQLELNLIFLGEVLVASNFCANTKQLTSPCPQLYREFLDQVTLNCDKAYEMKNPPSHRCYDYLKDLIELTEILDHPPVIGDDDWASGTFLNQSFEDTDASTARSSLSSPPLTASSATSFNTCPTSLNSILAPSPGSAVSWSTPFQVGHEFEQRSGAEYQVSDDDTSMFSPRSSVQSDSSLTPLISSFPRPGYSSISRRRRNVSQKVPP